MTPHELAKRNKSLVKQRNVMSAFVGVSMLTTLLVGAVAFKSDQSVVIIPSTVNEYTIRKGRVPDLYLIDLSRDMSNLLYNRHPNDTDYFKENILRRVEPRYHDSIRAQIAQDEIENKYKAGETNWRPDKICVLRMEGGGLVSEVVGQVDTYVNDRKVESRSQVSRFRWSLSGTRVWLSDVEQLSREESECLKMKGSN